jgi:hypothetical protein
VNRHFSWFSAALLLPLLGWVGLIPLLLAFPIYTDELQWKVINSRLLLDSGKLNYIFPECSKGILLNPPVSWYPARFIDAIIYSDMTNPQILRYWGIGIFVAIILYCAWFIRFILKPDIGYAAVAGAVLMPLSLGVLPFLLVMNRPEQGLIAAIIIGCTIPLILAAHKLTILQTWVIASLFALLSWIIVGTHIKGIFILPALLLAAFLSLRKWGPWLAVLAAASFGGFETYRLWSIRTDCPESPFLMQAFRAQTMSPEDLRTGVVSFLVRVAQNVLRSTEYLHSASFQQEYQSEWLPTASAPQNFVETIVNVAIPAIVVIGFLIVTIAFTASAIRAVRTRTLPDHGPLIAASLLACLVCIAGFQSGKNFYESALILPLLSVAVMLGLTTASLPPAVLSGGRKLMVVLSILALVNQLAIAARFYPNLPDWRRAIEDREQAQDKIKNLIGRCDIQANSATKHVLVDDFTYTVLWPTQEPYLLPYLYGWWATGIDASSVIRDRNIHAVVGRCSLVSHDIWSFIASDGRYCCGTRS